MGLPHKSQKPGAIERVPWSLLRTNYVILEITGAVCFRPEADLSGDRRAEHWIVGQKQIRIGRTSSRDRLRAQCVFQRRLIVEPRFYACSIGNQLQLMPGGAVEHEWLVAIAEFHVSPDAVVK